jgi:phosphatidylglycerophosphatase A
MAARRSNQSGDGAGGKYSRALARVVATAGGAGYAPVAPGTAGTAVAVPIAWALATVPWWGFVGVVATVTAIGIWAAAVADRGWQTHDSGRIVIDEVAGYLATVALVDRASWSALAVGFVVFRALDIAKPPPIRWIDERLPGGYGVVLDDVAAGVIGAAVMVGLDAAGALDALTRLAA